MRSLFSVAQVENNRLSSQIIIILHSISTSISYTFTIIQYVT